MSRPKSPESSYDRIFKELEKNKVRYLVVGGLALNLYNVNRFTMDVDMMLDLEKENLEKFIQAMQKLQYRPRVPVKAEQLTDLQTREMWKREKNAVVFTFIPAVQNLPSIDIFLSNPIDFNKAFSKRRTVKGGSFNISLLSPKDLVKLKQIASRDKDLLDIKILKRQMEI